MDARIQLNNLTGITLDGDIVLVEPLGEGGMGTVYRGHQAALNRNVCVKFMHFTLIALEDFAERFRREGKVLSRIRNSHVLEVYSFGILQGVYPYLVMELVAGQSLRSVLNSEGKLDWRRACDIVIQICDGLDAVHTAGFVHRDIKPDNIILQAAPNGEHAKIIDFGLTGYNRQSTVTETGDVIGSVYYMAPECFSGSQHNAGVDIYALGCLLYECICGSPPFSADSMAIIAAKHVKDPIPSLPDQTLPAEVRAALHAVITRACAKGSNDRFVSCTEMSAYLKQLLEEGSITHTSVNVLLAPIKNESALRSSSRPSKAAPGLTIIVIAISLLLFAPAIHEQCQSLIAPFFSKQNQLLLDQSRTCMRQGNYSGVRKLMQQLRSGCCTPAQRIDAFCQLALAEGYQGNYADTTKNLIEASKLLRKMLEESPDKTRAEASVFSITAVLHTKLPLNSHRTPMESLLAAQLPAGLSSELEKELRKLLSYRFTEQDEKNELVVNVALLQWLNGDYRQVLATLTSTRSVSDLDAKVIQKRIAPRANRQDQQEGAECYRRCVEIVNSYMGRDNLDWSRPYIRFLRLIDRGDCIDSSFEKLLQSMARSKYRDSISPSIWDVLHYRYSNSKGKISNPEEFRQSIQTLVMEEAQHSNVDDAYRSAQNLGIDNMVLTRSLISDLTGVIFAERYTEKGFCNLENLVYSKMFSDAMKTPARSMSQHDCTCELGVANFIGEYVNGPPRTTPQWSIDKAHLARCLRLFAFCRPIVGKHYLSKSGEIAYAQWAVTANKLPAAAFPANEEKFFAQSIIPDPRIKTFTKCTINDAITGAYAQRNNYSQVTALRRSLYKLITEDLSSAKPSLSLAEAINYPEHLLNANTLKEAADLSSFLDEQVMKSGKKELIFLQALWGTRIGAALRSTAKVDRSEQEMKIAREMYEKERIKRLAPGIAEQIQTMNTAGNRSAALRLLDDWSNRLNTESDGQREPFIDLMFTCAQMAFDDFRSKRLADSSEDCVLSWTMFARAVNLVPRSAKNR